MKCHTASDMILHDWKECIPYLDDIGIPVFEELHDVKFKSVLFLQGVLEYATSNGVVVVQFFSSDFHTVIIHGSNNVSMVYE